MIYYVDEIITLFYVLTEKQEFNRGILTVINLLCIFEIWVAILLIAFILIQKGI